MLSLGELDDLTPKYLAVMRALSRQTRCVIDALAEAGSPATAHAVADCSRLDVHTVSMVLGRLATGGSSPVIVDRTKPRRHLYQFRDPVFGEWLRARRSPSRARAERELTP